MISPDARCTLVALPLLPPSTHCGLTYFRREQLASISSLLPAPGYTTEGQTSATMPRPRGSEHPCWDEVERVYTPNRRHPNVTCRWCSTGWVSNERLRVIDHLAACERLPEELKTKYQKSGEEQEESSSKKRKRSNAPEFMTPQRQQNAVEGCAAWIYAAGLPLNTTENPAFLAFINQINAGFKPPTRRFLAGRLLENERKRQEEEDRLRNEQLNVVPDGWLDGFLGDSGGRLT